MEGRRVERKGRSVSRYNDVTVPANRRGMCRLMACRGRYGRRVVARLEV